MKRRNFFTAACAAVLAAPLSLLAKRSPPFCAADDPYVELMFSGSTPEDWARVMKQKREIEARQAEQKKAAGPWRIVEQSEDGHCLVERECDPGEVVLDCVACDVGDGKIRMFFRAQSSEDRSREDKSPLRWGRVVATLVSGTGDRFRHGWRAG